MVTSHQNPNHKNTQRLGSLLVITPDELNYLPKTSQSDKFEPRVLLERKNKRVDFYLQCTNARNVYAGLLLRTFQNQLRFFSTTANVCEQFRNHRKFYDDLRTVPKIFSNCIVYFLFCIVLYCIVLNCVVLF